MFCVRVLGSLVCVCMLVLRFIVYALALICCHVVFHCVFCVRDLGFFVCDCMLVYVSDCEYVCRCMLQCFSILQVYVHRMFVLRSCSLFVCACILSL